MSGESWLWWLAIPRFLLVGFVFLFIFSVMIGAASRADRAEELASIFANRRHERSQERLDILYKIGSPECPDGTFSPRQVVLWEKYRELENQNKYLTDLEMQIVVNNKTVIDDRTQYELDNGINPY